jgi:tRNA(Ile)-lysidine synthase
MHRFVRRLLTEWRRLQLPQTGETFLAAVSGGADSVALLLALAELRDNRKLAGRTVVAHFNHSLRGAASDEDAAFVESLSAKFNFELALGTGDVSREGNLEQSARAARYEFLLRTAEDLDARGILTAHTLDDQAETFLLNLIRGSGLAGLAGMRAVTENFRLKTADPKSENETTKPAVRLIRPLLGWARRGETENFCRERNIEFRLDSMNENLEYSRVRVRKILLPALAEFNPRIIETLSRTAGLLRLENEYLEAVESRGPEIVAGPLAVGELKTLARPALFRLLRRWLTANRGDTRRLELKHLEALERLITSRKSGRLVELPGGETVVKSEGALYFRRPGLETAGTNT